MRNVLVTMGGGGGGAGGEAGGRAVVVKAPCSGSGAVLVVGGTWQRWRQDGADRALANNGKAVRKQVAEIEGWSGSDGGNGCGVWEQVLQKRTIEY
ncbi:hypothetical protein AMTR_s00061p00186070 [Amborella trichopoda]|uniref:Uncharacterized protein n=1 Tax=Amborella trichopoda TaxID=13333 RepID=U5D0R7_AMBTC|nr:hypothetical protein AMTR_s00061p00186070 [Amborella trichopoda]